MKWIAGNSPYYQVLEADSRYTVAKSICPVRTTYRAWYRAPAPTPMSAHVEDVNVARKAAEGHYAAMQRKAA